MRARDGGGRRISLRRFLPPKPSFDCMSEASGTGNPGSDHRNSKKMSFPREVSGSFFFLSKAKSVRGQSSNEVPATKRSNTPRQLAAVLWRLKRGNNWIWKALARLLLASPHERPPTHLGLPCLAMAKRTRDNGKPVQISHATFPKHHSSRF